VFGSDGDSDLRSPFCTLCTNLGERALISKVNVEGLGL
jgi:hypothetical protein